MKQYIDIVNEVLDIGEYKQNRTGINTKWLPGLMFKHNMNNGFPILTTKKIFHKIAAVELEGFINGITDKNWYKERKCNIWNNWCNPSKIKEWEYTMARYDVYGLNGERDSDNYEKDKLAQQISENDLGPIYGYQWRRFNCIYDSNQQNLLHDFPICEKQPFLKGQRYDQLATLIDTLEKNPLDRRMIVSAWNPEQLSSMALPPCHLLFQCMSDGKNLDLMWYQRSVDIAIGLPFDILHYGLLLHLIAKTVNMKPRFLIGSLADCHIYENHIDKIRLQTYRKFYELPKLEIETGKNIFNWTHNDYYLIDYKHHSKIKYEVAI